MKTFSEKEEKLNSSLQKLKKLKFENPQLTEQTKNLKAQKNQLEIEKSDIEEKYRVLLTEHETLRKKIKDEKLSQRHKELKFNEKIDELNQETDILLEAVSYTHLTLPTKA